ncbi:glycosyl hydrolase family 18 protein [Sphingobacterium psychroaquaticum]|uniref:chitinase n=1 Tax=Sphingobacterium psychroaquaticum TaxID=561061 RepID=A0A1X7KRY0_9SPHI|nr:glycosyl hydrolase family 18 protein [Sphingobacterium psychroaquaticum]SMG44351.1 Chitinase, GH18 family [Sphingobacterium psychroaquaticum]
MKRYILLLISCLHLLTACGKEHTTTENPPRKAFVVGYLFANTGLLEAAKKLDFTKITHLNIAFINPDATGTFPTVLGLSETVKLAHQHDVKVFASFAGGSPPEHLKDLLKPAKQKALIVNFGKLVDTYSLDGIDVDLEGDFIDENYESFVVGLSDLLRAKKKLMTAAVATWTSNRITDKALARYDLVHIMSYDYTGPWNKSNAGPHATYAHMVKDFTHWRDVRQVAPEKLVIGLPFYGYGFGPSIADDITYKALVAQYPEAVHTDEIVIPQQGTFYYNGAATIASKAIYAREQGAGGVMVWHLLGDADAPHALLQIIQDNLYPTTSR